MPIKDLQPKQGNAEVEATVIDKGEIREFNKFGKTGRVCNAKIKDSTGTIALTLWNEQIDQVNIGDKIKITNGWVNEWQGEMQLTTGKFGKLEVLESKGVTGDEETEADLIEGKTSDEGEHVLTEDEKLESETEEEKPEIEEEKIE
jgi:ssDNA-binding replication factor A large subunit